MRLLVTGGAGYIGSHVTRLLVEQGHEVAVFDSLTAGHRAAVDVRAQLIVGDLLDKEAVQRAFAGAPYDGILHFASHIMVGESMERPFKYLHDNVLATMNLLEVATAHKVERFILSSTANLFDAPQRIPINEDEPLIPGSVYGETKFWGERMLHWMERLYGLRYACLRYFNACGAHPDGTIGEDHHPETHLIPLVLQVALGQRDHITIYGDDYDTPDGTCIRDYVHVMDLASAHLLALQALEDGRSRVYNLGSGSGYSVRQVIEAARKVTGHPIPAVVGPRRAGDLPVLVADSQRIQRELGWEAEFDDLEKIIASAWRWHKTHPNGYADRV
ncbi:MAG: UDP-glucose 4-epimerase GalE [Anaerolineae bacterium]|nr:UDP-glucose 4-epimerase GalE [Anaerolineae bacterium]MDW8172074.1 UDP-glucose 4-epimerase GalE [Anaerolineae bacterium]